MFGRWNTKYIQDKAWNHQHLRWCMQFYLICFFHPKSWTKCKKSFGRVWLCLHEHEVWCDRSEAGQPTHGRAADVHAACALGLYSRCFTMVLETPCPLTAAVSEMQSWIMYFHILSWKRNLFCISEPLHSVNPSAVTWGLSAASQLPSSFELKSEYRLLPFLKCCSAGSPLPGILQYKLEH